MEHNVIIESLSDKDVYRILTYINETFLEPAVAKRTYLSIIEQILSLYSMPLRYTLIEEESYRSMEIRKIPVEN